MDQPFWDGQLPFNERQNIEEYQRSTEPAIGQFISALSDQGMAPLPDSTSELTKCGSAGIDGYTVTGPVLFGTYVDRDVVVQKATDILKPAGFTELVENQSDIGTINLWWFNTEDGGYVNVGINEKNNRATLDYRSGCRPSDGSTTGIATDRIMPAWEKQLGELTPPE